MQPTSSDWGIWHHPTWRFSPERGMGRYFFGFGLLKIWRTIILRDNEAATPASEGRENS